MALLKQISKRTPSQAAVRSICPASRPWLGTASAAQTAPGAAVWAATAPKHRRDRSKTPCIQNGRAGATQGALSTKQVFRNWFSWCHLECRTLKAIHSNSGEPVRCEGFRGQRCVKVPRCAGEHQYPEFVMSCTAGLIPLWLSCSRSSRIWSRKRIILGTVKQLLCFITRKKAILGL